LRVIRYRPERFLEIVAGDIGKPAKFFV